MVREYYEIVSFSRRGRLEACFTGAEGTAPSPTRHGAGDASPAPGWDGRRRVTLHPALFPLRSFTSSTQAPVWIVATPVTAVDPKVMSGDVVVRPPPVMVSVAVAVPLLYARPKLE